MKLSAANYARRESAFGTVRELSTLDYTTQIEGVLLREEKQKQKYKFE